MTVAIPWDGSSYEERLVGAALGWSREVRVPVSTPARKARALDVANATARVDVELDNKLHDKEADAIYDDALRASGWTVLRFLNRDAINELDRVCTEASSAAGVVWPIPTEGSLDEALSWSATDELEALMRSIANRLAEVFVPQVVNPGIVAFWLRLGSRFVPAAYLFVTDAFLILTDLLNRLAVNRNETSYLQARIRDLPVYLAWHHDTFQLWPGIASKMAGVLAALDDHLLGPARAYGESSDAGRA